MSSSKNVVGSNYKFNYWFIYLFICINLDLYNIFVYFIFTHRVYIFILFYKLNKI